MPKSPLVLMLLLTLVALLIQLVGFFVTTDWDWFPIASLGVHFSVTALWITLLGWACILEFLGDDYR